MVCGGHPFLSAVELWTFEKLFGFSFEHLPSPVTYVQQFLYTCDTCQSPLPGRLARASQEQTALSARLCAVPRGTHASGTLWWSWQGGPRRKAGRTDSTPRLAFWATCKTEQESLPRPVVPRPVVTCGARTRPRRASPPRFLRTPQVDLRGSMVVRLLVSGPGGPCASPGLRHAD